jgi:hypothetical protein
MKNYTDDQIQHIQDKFDTTNQKTISYESKELLEQVNSAAGYLYERRVKRTTQWTTLQQLFNDPLSMPIYHENHTHTLEKAAVALLFSLLLDEKKTHEVWHMPEQKLQMIWRLTDDPFYLPIIIAREEMTIYNTITTKNIPLKKIQLLMQDSPDDLFLTILRKNPELILSENSKQKYNQYTQTLTDDEMEQWIKPQDDQNEIHDMVDYVIANEQSSG